MVLGITGGVGSGKSTVLGLLEKEYNALIIMADDVSRELMEPGGESYKAVLKEFGEGVLVPEEVCGYSENRPMDRPAIAKMVFADEKKLERLNEITHPQVKEEIQRRIEAGYKEDPDRLIVVEAALLIEAGYTDMLDEIWAVITDYDVRLKRLMESRGYTKEKTDSIIGNQMSNEEFIERTDYAVNNSGDFEGTARQVAERIAFLKKSRVINTEK